MLSFLVLFCVLSAAVAAVPQQYDIRIGDGKRPNNKCEGDNHAAILADGKGKQYRCCLDGAPSPSAADETESETASVSTSVAKTRLEKAVARIQALLQLNGPIRHRPVGSYWAYEISPAEVKQFRPSVVGAAAAQQSSSSSIDSSIAADVDGPVFSLGMRPSVLAARKVEEEKEAAAEAAAATKKEADDGKEKEPPSSLPSSGDSDSSIDAAVSVSAIDAELVGDESGSLLLRTHYVNGTDGRQAFVDYRCGPGIPAHAHRHPRSGDDDDDDNNEGGAGAAAAAASGTVPSSPLLLSLVSVEEESRRYVLTVETSDRTVCKEILPSVSGPLQVVKGNCLEHSSGWWTYEVCLYGKIRQYHATPISSSSSASASSSANSNNRVNKPNGGGEFLIEQESLLGVYESSKEQGGGDRLERFGETLGEPPAIVQRYVGGSICALTGKPRSTVVRIECLPMPMPMMNQGSGNGGSGRRKGKAGNKSKNKNAKAGLGDDKGQHDDDAMETEEEEDEEQDGRDHHRNNNVEEIAWGLKSISEPSTCSYKVVLALSSACAHPELAPRTTTATTTTLAGGSGGLGGGADGDAVADTAAALLATLINTLKAQQQQQQQQNNNNDGAAGGSGSGSGSGSAKASSRGVGAAAAEKPVLNALLSAAAAVAEGNVASARSSLAAARAAAARHDQPITIHCEPLPEVISTTGEANKVAAVPASPSPSSAELAPLAAAEEQKQGNQQ